MDLTPTEADLAHRETSREGVYAVPLSPKQLQQYREYLRTPEFLALTTAEQLHWQCARVVRDKDGNEFDNLASAERIESDDIPIAFVQDVIRDCMEAVAGGGKRRSTNGRSG